MVWEEWDSLSISPFSKDGDKPHFCVITDSPSRFPSYHRCVAVGYCCRFLVAPLRHLVIFGYVAYLYLLLFVSFIFVLKLNCECYGGKFMGFKLKHILPITWVLFTK